MDGWKHILGWNAYLASSFWLRECTTRQPAKPGCVTSKTPRSIPGEGWGDGRKPRASMGSSLKNHASKATWRAGKAHVHIYIFIHGQFYIATSIGEIYAVNLCTYILLYLFERRYKIQANLWHIHVQYYTVSFQLSIETITPRGEVSNIWNTT